MLCLGEDVGPVFCHGGPPNGDLENRAAEVVVTPAAAQSVQILGDWAPAELVKAQAVDPELAVICGWRLNSEDPPPWGDVIEHSEATKAYRAQWDLLELSGGLVQEWNSGRRAYPVSVVDPTQGLTDRGYDAGSQWVYR